MRYSNNHELFCERTSCSIIIKPMKELDFITIICDKKTAAHFPTPLLPSNKLNSVLRFKKALHALFNSVVIRLMIYTTRALAVLVSLRKKPLPIRNVLKYYWTLNSLLLMLEDR